MQEQEKIILRRNLVRRCPNCGSKIIPWDTEDKYICSDCEFVFEIRLVGFEIPT